MIERLWNPFQTCSTADNRPVELKFPNGDVELGYFSSSQGRWVYAGGKPFPEGVYPSHWRSPQPLRKFAHRPLQDKTAEKMLNNVTDFLAATLAKPDQRAWDQLLIYCPREVIERRVLAATTASS